MRRREGEAHLVTGSGAPVYTGGGKLLGAVWVFHDVTDHHRMKQELLKKSQLESLGTLAGGIAHDFNNLLTAILGNISLAALSLDSGPQLQERLAEVEKAAVRATGLAKKLLTFAKGGEPVKRVVNPAELVLRTCRDELKNFRLQYKLNLPPDLWQVEVDESQVSLALAEILANAEEAMPEGGGIRVEVANCEVSGGTEGSLRPGRYVHLTISDEGGGISPEHLGKVFDPYFSTKAMGNGMGLTLAYSIIQGHQGQISVESLPGRGTRIQIYLPATGGNKERPVSPKAEIRYGQGKILLMDDEAMILQTTGLMLKKLGYQVTNARDGQEALELYRRAREEGAAFDAVILDLTVPGGMGGEEAIQQLRDLDPQVKAIVSSGYADNRVMAGYAEYGFQGVIPKPYRIGQLSEVVHRVLHPEGEEAALPETAAADGKTGGPGGPD
jgi:nitrogen-specific signal transduction histidine kinase/ActR/RegA family two-component response regulator